MKFLALALTLALGLSACGTAADQVSHNISQEAGEFKVLRRVVFYNGITDTYILSIQGYCQVDHADKLSVTCKDGPNDYKKHYLGLSDNVTYFSEHLSGTNVSEYRSKVFFRPEAIIPDVDLKTSVTP